MKSPLREVPISLLLPLIDKAEQALKAANERVYNSTVDSRVEFVNNLRRNRWYRFLKPSYKEYTREESIAYFKSAGSYFYGSQEKSLKSTFNYYLRDIEDLRTLCILTEREATVYIDTQTARLLSSWTE